MSNTQEAIEIAARVQELLSGHGLPETIYNEASHALLVEIPHALEHDEDRNKAITTCCDLYGLRMGSDRTIERTLEELKYDALSTLGLCRLAELQRDHDYWVSMNSPPAATEV